MIFGLEWSYAVVEEMPLDVLLHYRKRASLYAKKQGR